MNTFKLNENWTKFKSFIFDNLQSVDKNATGFMYNDNEIIVRSFDNKTIDMIKQNYDTVPCEQPSNFLDKDRGWNYFGNSNLFDTKI